MKKQIKMSARQLLMIASSQSIYDHFAAQQVRALSTGKITRTLPKRKLEVFAEDCHSSLRKELHACATPRDLALVVNALSKEIAPNRLGFLRATGLPKKAALAKLQ